MYLKNNSKKSWLQYNCGSGVLVDILPESVFEVDDKSALVILRNLGADAWVTKTEAPVKKVEVKEEKEEVKKVNKSKK